MPILWKTALEKFSFFFFSSCSCIHVLPHITISDSIVVTAALSQIAYTCGLHVENLTDPGRTPLHCLSTA